MNRIVIIGNGFDLAHGLPTSYHDFMQNLIDSIAKYDEHGRIVSEKNSYPEQQSFFFYYKKNEQNADPWIGASKIESENKFELTINPHSGQKSIYYNSLIQKHEELKYWSSLESYYFKVLTENKNNPENIRTINEEFDHLKDLLFNYLKTEVDDKIGNDKKYDLICNPIKEMLMENGRYNCEFEKNYFINFNYTSRPVNQCIFNLRSISNNEEKYADQIEIHGNLFEPENPIIFGYGDENSNEYKELELLGNNELLKNFKTFQYLRSNKYNQVLGLLEESDEIYVQIIGHSCGLCDKALLRTIFQHPNVKHIESTYHGSDTNYFENLYNISRIFDDNSLMRTKLIPLEKSFKIP